MGALLTLNVTWAPVVAASGSPTSGTVPPIYIWSLAHYMIDSSNHITGTTRTCGNQVPPLALNMTGDLAIGAPTDAGIVSVLSQTPTTKVWDKDIRTAMTTGTLGGWNIGSSILIDPTTSIAGLAPTSMFSNPATMWPASSMTIPTADLTDDDGDGAPGITDYPLSDNAMGYYLPATGLGGTAPKADKLYIVSRTEVTLYGKSTSCTDSSGTVTVPNYNLHVVGCHDLGAMDCMASEWQFIDGNVTVYAGSGGKSSTITGDFKSKQLSTDGGDPGCDAVITAFPSPMPQPTM